MADKNVMIKVVGKDDNLNFLSKVKGKWDWISFTDVLFQFYNDALRKFFSTEEKNMPREMLKIRWEAAPLLCFQNERQSESALEVRKF